MIVWLTLKRIVVGAWAWLRDNPMAVVGMLGAVLGAWFMWKRTTNQIASLEDAVQVQAAKVSVAKKIAKAEVLEARADDTEAEVKELKRDIVASKKRAIEIHKGTTVEGKTDEQIAIMFSAAGL